MDTDTSKKAKLALIDRGSVLAIPVSSAEWALGQVICPGTNFYFGVALVGFNYLPTADEIGGKSMGLFSWTNDAEVFRGGWKNLGVLSGVPELALPEYKIFIDGMAAVETFDGRSVRPFDNSRDAKLSFRKIRSPLVVQDAVQAALGYREWKAEFGEMLK